MLRFFSLLLFALLLPACQAGALRELSTAAPGSPEPAAVQVVATPAALPAFTPTPSAVWTGTAVPASASATPSPSLPSSLPSSSPSSVPSSPPSSQACTAAEGVCILDGHFLFKRPIPLVQNASIDKSYRYGLTQSGKREPHHGVEFPNAQNTPVLAVAAGEVVFAGDDKNVAVAWVPAYYGNVVVIAHDLPGQPRLFSLYAHLFKIEVSLGQRVRQGEQIGRVGATGNAIGSHLHFEVRVGQNDYRSNRNPDLWLLPLKGMGVLAGRIENERGQLLDGMLNVQRIENGVLNALPVTALETYITRESQPVMRDDLWQESFAAGELSAGEYRLSLHLNGVLYEKIITIEPGRLTFVVFVVK